MKYICQIYKFLICIFLSEGKIIRTNIIYYKTVFIKVNLFKYFFYLFDKNISSKLKELDTCIDDQVKFNQLISDLITNLDFEDSETKKNEEKKEAKNEDSSPENKQDENNASKEEDKNNNTDLNVLDTSFESLSENSDSDENEAKETSVDESVVKRNQKNLFKEKYKIFTNEYDEIKNAEDLEKEDERRRKLAPSHKREN